MPFSPHSQSIAEFRQNTAETLDRLNQTREVEILTVDGQARAVLLSPEAYDELAREAQLTRDVTVIRRSIQESAAGQGESADNFFDGLRAEIMAKKSDQNGSR